MFKRNMITPKSGGDALLRGCEYILDSQDLTVLGPPNIYYLRLNFGKFFMFFNILGQEIGRKKNCLPRIHRRIFVAAAVNKATKER